MARRLADLAAYEDRPSAVTITVGAHTAAALTWDEVPVAGDRGVQRWRSFTPPIECDDVIGLSAPDWIRTLLLLVEHDDAREDEVRILLPRADDDLGRSAIEWFPDEMRRARERRLEASLVRISELAGKVLAGNAAPAGALDKILAIARDHVPVPLARGAHDDVAGAYGPRLPSPMVRRRRRT